MVCRSCTLSILAVTVVGAGALTFGLTSAPAQTAPASKPAAPSAPAVAPAAKPAAAPAAAGVVQCKIDDTHSMGLFRVHHLGASQFWGRFNAVDGSFQFTPGSAEGMKFDVTIQTDSVDTGVDKLDQHLRSPDFFAAKEYPTMTFVSTGARKTGDNVYEVSGNFTMRGVSKPITAKLEFTGMAEFGQGQKAGFEATFSVKRSEFGVKYGVDKGAVGDDVRVVVCLEGAVQK